MLKQSLFTDMPYILIIVRSVQSSSVPNITYKLLDPVVKEINYILNCDVNSFIELDKSSYFRVKLKRIKFGL